MGAFMSGLRQGKLFGIRGNDGKVLVPPVEWDPASGEALGQDLVHVGPQATVESWTWVSKPTPKHPLDRPFAFAQVKPEGADTTLIHAVDAGSIDAMSTGMRVMPRWCEERHGRIDDIECWEPA